MDDESFREIYSKLLGKYYNKEGIVIDTRWNGGGRLHEDIEVLFSGDKYLTQEVHGRPTGEMPHGLEQTLCNDNGRRTTATPTERHGYINIRISANL